MAYNFISYKAFSTVIYMWLLDAQRKFWLHLHRLYVYNVYTLCIVHTIGKEICIQCWMHRVCVLKINCILRFVCAFESWLIRELWLWRKETHSPLRWASVRLGELNAKSDTNQRVNVWAELTLNINPSSNWTVYFFFDDWVSKAVFATLQTTNDFFYEIALFLMTSK